MGIKPLIFFGFTFINSIMINAYATAEDIAFFTTPSKNISCAYIPKSPDIQATVRCDIDNFSPSLKKTPHQTAEDIAVMGRCTLKRMNAFEIQSDATRANVYCPSDTVKYDRPQILSYGQTWSRAGFFCSSEANGIRCANNLGHGFKLSRTIQELF